VSPQLSSATGLALISYYPFESSERGNMTAIAGNQVEA
jgi:hypothetical protein